MIMLNEEIMEILVIKSFSEELTSIDIQSINRWRDESPANMRHYYELKNLWQITHPAFLVETIDADTAEMKFMNSIKERPKLIQPNIFVWFQRVAAIIILPLISLAGYLVYNQFYNFNYNVVAYQEVTTNFGLSSKVNLPDGSTVWLNSGSKIKFPVAFNSNDRNVYLSGEAFFKVHADKKHPFIVSTDKMKVKATGTKFNVEAYLYDSITAVTLVEGIVDVKMDGTENKKLLPNQRIVLNSLTQQYKLTDTDAQHWGEWKDGILAFRDEPLKDVFKRIGRMFNVSIQVKDSTISKQLYRATFEGESLTEILRLLKMTSPIQYKIISRVKQGDNHYSKELIEVFSNKK